MAHALVPHVLVQPLLVAVPVAFACRSPLEPLLDRVGAHVDVEDGVKGYWLGRVLESAEAAALLKDGKLCHLLGISQCCAHAARIQLAHSRRVAPVDEARQLVAIRGVWTPRLLESLAVVVPSTDGFDGGPMEIAAADVTQRARRKPPHQLGAERSLS